jgi:hypothetical protein
MKIIFLDFDGVLNHELWYKKRFETINKDDVSTNYPYYEFDLEAVNNLNKIIKETDAKVVVSSTWRIGKTVKQLQDMLNLVGFKGEVIDTSPSFYARGIDNEENKINYTIPRGCEIDWWLENKGKFQRINWSMERQEEYLEKSSVKNYVILDDDSDMLLSQKEHFIKTSQYRGLTESDVNIAINILKSKITDLYYV